MLRELLRKLFIKRKFLFLLAIVLCLTVFQTQSSVKKNLLSDVGARAAYEEAMEKYGGELTKEKRQMIESEKKEQDKISAKKESMKEEYKNGNISYKEYSEELASLKESLAQNNGFNAFYEKYLKAVKNNTDIIDDIPWKTLLEMKVNMADVLLVIIAVLILNVSDFENGVSVFHKSTRMFRLVEIYNFLLIVILPFALALLQNIVKYITAEICYGVAFHNFSPGLIITEETFFKAPTLISQFLINILVCAASLVALSLVTYIAGKITKKTLPTAATGLFTAVIVQFFMGG